jgi:cell division initiation protein
MKITPLEIRQKTFEKAFRGLDKDEVNGFLLSLSHEWERMLVENKDTRTKLDHADKEVQKLREVESTLYKTLKTAEDTRANIIDQANRTAELLLKETQMSADSLMNEVKRQAKTIIENADARAREILEEMQDEVKEIEENYRIIENQKDNMVSQLKMLSGDVMDKVAKMNDPKTGRGIESHLKKVREILRETSEKVAHDEKKTILALDQIKRQDLKEARKEEPVDAEINEEPEYNSTEVKQNRIVGDSPISKKNIETAKSSERVMQAVENDDLSFFDQLED